MIARAFASPESSVNVARSLQLQPQGNGAHTKEDHHQNTAAWLRHNSEAFTFEDSGTAADDFVIDAPNGVQVLVDAMSMNLLSGAEIDFKRDLTSSQFVIRNPNISSSCGCGQSFSI